MNLVTMFLWLFGAFSEANHGQTACGETSTTCRSATATADPSDADELPGPPPSPRISNGF